MKDSVRCRLYDVDTDPIIQMSRSAAECEKMVKRSEVQCFRLFEKVISTVFTVEDIVVGTTKCHQ